VVVSELVSRSKSRFPHHPHHRFFFALFLIGRVCYFLRISFENVEENQISKFDTKSMCKSCGESAENLRNHGGFRCAKPADFLRQSGGEAAEIASKPSAGEFGASR